MSAPLRILTDILTTVQPAIAELQAANPDGARPHLDRLRELRSFLADHLLVSDVADWSRDEDVIKLAIEASRVVNNSFDTVDLLRNRFRLSENNSSLSPHDIMDDIFPVAWDWARDLLVFAETPTVEWTKALQERGQDRILFLKNHEVDFDGNNENWISTSSIDDIKSVLEKWHPHFPRRYVSFCGQDCNALDSDCHLQATLDAIIREQSTQKTIEDFSKRWVSQQYLNSKKAVVSKGLSELTSLISGKNVLIVSPGPSLAKNIEKLKSLDSHFLIIAVAQACPALVKHGIVPDLVAVIDAQDYSKVLDGFDCAQAYLMIDDRCAPSFFNKGFKETFVLSSRGSFSGILEVMGENPYYSIGGSVSVVAFDICVQSNASSITLVGQDLSVENGSYYNRPGSEAQPEFLDDSETFFQGGRAYRVYKLPGCLGGEVRTRQDYWQYHYEFEKIASHAPESIRLFNATEGGAFIEGFEHVRLQEVFEKLEPKSLIYSLDKLPELKKTSREKKLKRIHQRHIKICDKIDRFCRDILRVLLEASQYRQNSPKIDNLEKLIAAETNKLPMLSGLLQGELKYFESRLRQCTDLNENLSLSRSLYTTIKSTAAEYREIVCAANDRI